jgi:hypothetical protein
VPPWQRRHPQLPPACCAAWRAATARVSTWCWAHGALGAEVAPGLHEAELPTCTTQEWARSADDVLWRRTKLGLHYEALPSAERSRLVPAHTDARRARTARRRHGAECSKASSSRSARPRTCTRCDLTLVPRAVTVLLGATQAGKTTLMRADGRAGRAHARPRAGRRART